ncbi:membrane protein [Helicobacter pylori oki128]|nr:membrane protein [Helicobacter pylori oki128]
MFSILAFFFKNGFLKLFYRFSSHFIVKLIFFYFLENTESILKSFSPF